MQSKVLFLLLVASISAGSVDLDKLMKQNPFLVDVGIINGKHYFSNEGTMAWHEANEFCRNLGLFWGRVDNAEENEFITRYLNDTSDYNYIWLSGSDYAVEGLWIWPQDGSPIAYANWGPNHPIDGRDFNCIQMTTVGSWYNYPCTINDAIPICHSIVT